MVFEAINKIFCRCQLLYLSKHCFKNYSCLALKTFTSYSLTCPSFGSLGQSSLFVFLALFTCQCPLIILIFVFQKHSKVFNFSSQESHPIPKTNKNKQQTNPTFVLSEARRQRIYEEHQ